MVRKVNVKPDIFPKHKAQHENAEIEALFASVGEGLIVTDDKGAVTRINKTALNIFGYKKSQILKKRFTDKVQAVHENGEPVNAIDRPIVKAFLTGQLINEKIIYRSTDGKNVPVQVTVSPLLRKGIPVGAVQVFRDISSEIQADKLKSEFISIASHQLRTPLSSVNIYAGMLLEGIAGDLNDQQRAFAQTILASARRMNELIDTLLNITRIEAGGIRVIPARVEVSNLLEEIVSEVIPKVEEKDMKLNLITGPEPIQLKTDGLLVKEVLANLLTNAIKYTPEGGTITVKIKHELNNVIFSVSDTGYGIPKELQKNIFTKFFRADNILLKDVSGTGLGLYLTKAIVNNLDGDLWFDSVEDEGSTFYFSLPKHGSIAKHGNFKIGSTLR
jgi:PAS domain S-box-containing protein